MGNEMGNNNTSGLREEDNTGHGESQLEVARADDSKRGQNHEFVAIEDEDSQGKKTGLLSGDFGTQDPKGDDHIAADKEEDNMKSEGKASQQDAARTDDDGKNMKSEGKSSQQDAAQTDDDDKEQIHILPASKENYTSEETVFSSMGPDGVAEHDIKQNQEEKEQDNNVVPEDREKSVKEATYADEAKEQDHLVPEAEDKNTHENEAELLCSEQDGTNSVNVDNQKQDEKVMVDSAEKDDSTKLVESKEISLQEAASTEEIEEQAHLVDAAADKSTHGTETGLVSGNPDGTVFPSVDKQKQDEKEEGSSITDEYGQKFSQETSSTDVIERLDQLLPAVEDNNTNGNETGSVSSDSERTADPQDENPKKDETVLIDCAQKDDSTKLVEAKDLSSPEATSTEEIEEEIHLVDATADNNTPDIETGLVSSNPDGTAIPTIDKQKQDEKEEGSSVTDEARQKSSQETSSTDAVERQNHSLPAVEDNNTHGNETGLVSSDSERIADPQDDNPKMDETEEDKMIAEPQEKSLAENDQADDNKEKNQAIQAAKGEDCNKTEAEAESAAGNLTAIGDVLDKEIEGPGQTEVSPMAESTKVEARPSEAVDEGKGAQSASSSETLEDLEIQQESNFAENLSGTNQHFENSMIKEDEGTSNSISDTASSTSHDRVSQEPAVVEPELAKSQTEPLVQVHKGLKSEETTTIFLSCQDQGNGFNLDSSISPAAVEIVFPDPSPVVEKESKEHEFLGKEMATEEVRSEEKSECNDGYEAGNHSGCTTTTMTDLSNEVGEKCNGKLPSEVNSIKNDFCMLQGEAILSEETQNYFLQEVSTTADKEIEVLSEKDILVREDSKNGNSKHCQYLIPSRSESTEKTKTLESEEVSNAGEPNASMMKGHQNEVKRSLLASDEDRPYEKAEIVENGFVIDASINCQNEAKKGQQKDLPNEVNLVIDPPEISTNAFLVDQKYQEEEEEEENKIIVEMAQNIEDSNPTGNDMSKIDNGEQCIPRSSPKEAAEAIISGLSPKEEAEAFPSPSLFPHALPEKQQQDSDMECKKVKNSDESMAEQKQQTSAFGINNLTGNNNVVVSVVEFTKLTPVAVTMAETKPNEQFGSGKTPPAIEDGDYYQRESVGLGRLSTESNPENVSVHAQMRKSPSFGLDLRINARAEESDQTPLLYQDKTTVESQTSQPDVSNPGKPVANTEHGKNSSEYEAMPVEEKVVTLERSDSDKSKTPFLGFLKEDEEADHQMLITPEKQDNQSAAKKIIKVEVTSASIKGKDQKRKPRTSFFGTCMCCATVIN